jgi:hypothetical protein
MIENLPGKPDATPTEPAGRRGGRDLGEVVKGLERAPRPPGGRGRRQRWDEKPIHLNAGHTVDLVRASAEIMGADAAEAGEVGFMARLLIQATLPHSRPTENEHTRTNGHLTVRMMAPRDVGLPYGTYPRLLLAWVTTEAARTKSPDLVLGVSLSDFMAQIGMLPTGGRWGSVTRLRDHMRRLFSATISWTYSAGGAWLHTNVAPVESARLWWDPKSPDQSNLWESTVRLSRTFFEEITKRPVPLDMRALRELARERSPLALDLYTWLTYRMSYLREPTEIGWASLRMQFGADYASVHEFRRKFLEKLRRVKQLYPAAKVAPAEGGLTLWPSPTHVPTRGALDSPST